MPKPLMRDFMGLNGHTINFKPELYRPACKLVRDYHNIPWDLGPDSSSKTIYPKAKELGIDWEKMYGSWNKVGWEIDLCAQFSGPPTYWKDLPKDAYQYGLALSRFFGPSSRKLITSVEVGNEPGNYPDDVYRTLFENMARGFRDGDRRLKVVTCATFNTKSGPYWKGTNVFQGLEKLYDVLNVHSYAQAENWPTWRRSYPEDPKIITLKEIQSVIDWRNANAKGKEVWLTEFGYDSSTKPNEKTGDFARWVGVTDTQQARWLIRSFLVFSGMELDRAYMYFFNDEDKPQFHAAAGLTRNFQPKPSLYAMSHLSKTLWDYRFSRAVKSVVGDQYIYEYTHERDKSRTIWVAWSPTGVERTATITLTDLPGKIEKAERMPLAPNAVASVPFTAGKDQSAQIEIAEAPTYLFLKG